MGLIPLLEDQIKKYRKTVLVACCSAASFCTSQQVLAQIVQENQRLKTPEEWVKPEDERYTILLPFRKPQTEDERFVFEHNDVVMYMNWVRTKTDLKFVEEMAKVLAKNDSDAAANLYDILIEQMRQTGFVNKEDINKYLWSRNFYRQTLDPTKQPPMPVFYQLDDKGNRTRVRTTSIANIVLRESPKGLDLQASGKDVSPSVVVRAYFNAMQKGNLPLMRDNSCGDRLEQLTEYFKKDQVESASSDFKRLFSEYVQDKVYDDYVNLELGFARVRMECLDNGDLVNYTVGLKKDGGSWKVFRLKGISHKLVLRMWSELSNSIDGRVISVLNVDNELYPEYEGISGIYGLTRVDLDAAVRYELFRHWRNAWQSVNSFSIPKRDNVNQIKYSANKGQENMVNDMLKGSSEK
jgi:hypothetical protein